MVIVMKFINTITITMPCIPPKKVLTTYDSKQAWRYKKENAEFIQFKNELIMKHQKEIAILRTANEKYKNKLFIKVLIIIRKKVPDSFSEKKRERCIKREFCNLKPDTDNIRKSLFDAVFTTPKEVMVKGKKAKIRWSGFDERIYDDSLVKCWGDSDSMQMEVMFWENV